jgi:hypothetical protein
VTEQTPNTPEPATEAGRQAAADPTRQRPPDAGGTAEQPAVVERAHGEAIAAAAAEQVALREAEQAQQQAEAAHDEIDRLSRKERKAREKAERERQKAEAEHAHAADAERREQGEAMARAAESDVRAEGGDAAAAVGTHARSAGSLSGATLTSPGAPQAEPRPVAGPAAGTDDKPEILAGAAFAGAFLFAKLLKRIANR